MDQTYINRAQVTLLTQKIPEQPEIKDNTLTRTLQSCCLIPQRFLLSIIGCVGVCNAFTMRVCLNIAITKMVNQTKELTVEIDVDTDTFVEAACSNEIVSANATVVENPYGIFKWDEATQGFILSAFYYGYATTQVLRGYLAERYGGKWTLGLGLLSTALFTFLTPWVTRAGGGTWLFILRIIQGMGEGPTMPALMIMLSNWVPPHERSIQSAIVFGGAQIGNILGSSISGLLLSGGRDWAYVFYFYGGFSLIWFVLWLATYPFITKKELDYLKANVTKSDTKIRDPVPWKAILRSAPVWALVAAAVGHDWGYYTMVTDLPKYSHDVLKFNIATTGTLTALPYVAMWICSFIFCFVCDLCVRKRWHSIKTGRIIHTTIAATGPAICIILASYAGCNRNAAMAYFILSMALMGGFYSGMKVNALDLAPNFAGTLTSLVNTSSTFTGMVTPFLIGLLTPNTDFDNSDCTCTVAGCLLCEWRVAFWVCFFVLVGTNIVYNIWADGEQQWWDDVRQFGYPPGWKHGPLIRETNPEHPDSIKMSEEIEDNKVY